MDEQEEFMPPIGDRYHDVVFAIKASNSRFATAMILDPNACFSVLTNRAIERISRHLSGLPGERSLSEEWMRAVERVLEGIPDFCATVGAVLREHEKAPGGGLRNRRLHFRGVTED